VHVGERRLTDRSWPPGSPQSDHRRRRSRAAAGGVEKPYTTRLGAADWSLVGLPEPGPPYGSVLFCVERDRQTLAPWCWPSPARPASEKGAARPLPSGSLARSLFADNCLASVTRTAAVARPGPSSGLPASP